MTATVASHRISAMTTSKDRVIRLQGHRVVLRAKELSDAAKDYVWATDRELMRLDAADPYEMAFSVFLATYHQLLADPTKKQFAIETLSGDHIGNCVCYNIDNLRKEAELGIVIGDREFWGKGYGSDAVETLLRYSFEELGIRRISLHTLEWNIRAQECFEKCGFTPVERVVNRGLEFVKMEAVAPPDGSGIGD